MKQQIIATIRCPMHCDEFAAVLRGIQSAFSEPLYVNPSHDGYDVVREIKDVEKAKPE